MIYLEDCRETLKRDIVYDYVLTSPPDYNEVGLNPKKDSYIQFLDTWVPLVNPRKNLVSICITDRKSDGTIYEKHIDVIRTMEKNNWKVKTHKIWVKGLGINTFRLNYMHIMTFMKKPSKVNLTKEFKPDIFVDDKSTKYKNYGYGMSLDVCGLLIKEHTAIGDIVYDPFMGSGTTTISCVFSERKYVGIEKEKEYFEIAEARVEKALNPANLVKHDFF